MNTLLINLEHSKERLKFQTNQLEKLGISFSVLKAVSLEDINQVEYEKISQDWERPLRRAEVACFLSHLKAWKEVATLNEPMLILEDDALLTNKTAEILNALQSTENTQQDLVVLETRSRKKLIGKKANDIIAGYKLRKLYQDRTGSAGYILWPSGAKKLLSKSKVCRAAPADAFISSCYTLNAYQVEPAAIIQLDQCEKYSVTNNSFNPSSTISSETKPQPIYTTKLSRIRFKGRRIFSQLRMGVRHLSVLTKSTRKYINVNSDEFYSDQD